MDAHTHTHTRVQPPHAQKAGARVSLRPKVKGADGAADVAPAVDRGGQPIRPHATQAKDSRALPGRPPPLNPAAQLLTMPIFHTGWMGSGLSDHIANVLRNYIMYTMCVCVLTRSGHYLFYVRF